MTEMLVEREDIEVLNPWGPASGAVEAGLGFWQNWDTTPISQHKDTNPFPQAERKVQAFLPEELRGDNALAKVIVQATRLLTVINSDGDDISGPNLAALNEMLLAQTVDPSATADRMPIEQRASWIADDLTRFAQLANSYMKGE